MKVMLAASADPSKIRFPILASPKLDGIRAVVVGGVVMSRNMKPIPNRHVQELWGHEYFEGLDGELIVGPAAHPHAFRTTTSGVMSVAGQPDVFFHVFDDCAEPSRTYSKRLAGVEEFLKLLGRKSEVGKRTLLVPHTRITTLKGLRAFQEEVFRQGYEGVIVRDPYGPYKHGRSTVNEGYYLRLKYREDSEAEVLGYECQYHNANEAKRNGAGKLERSSKKAGKAPLDRLGKVTVRDLYTWVEFDLGTGFTDAEREKLWRTREQLPGQIVKYSFLPYGTDEKPRQPVFEGFRDRRDL